MSSTVHSSIKDDVDNKTEDNPEDIDRKTKDNMVKNEDDLYVYCNKVDGRCRTHDVNLTSRKPKSRVWITGRNGTGRHVYRQTGREACLSSISGGNSASHETSRGKLVISNFTTTTTC